MECRLRETLRISNEAGAANTVIFGNVLRFHVDEAIVDSYKIDPEKLRAIGRMGGTTYTRTRDRFDMDRPK